MRWEFAVCGPTAARGRLSQLSSEGSAGYTLVAAPLCIRRGWYLFYLVDSGWQKGEHLLGNATSLASKVWAFLWHVASRSAARPWRG